VNAKHDRVLGALAHLAHFTLLAGGHYRCLANLMRWSTHPAVNFHRGVEEALVGLAIGQRMAWLKQQLEIAVDGRTQPTPN
jgi:hypothetical protein